MQTQSSSASTSQFVTRYVNSRSTEPFAIDDLPTRRRAMATMVAGWAPPPPQTVSEWAGENRKLSSESSAEPGPWRNERVPYLRDIMDTHNDPRVRETWVMKGAQIAFTEAINNIIGY